MTNEAETITLRIENIKGEPSITGLISTSQAAEMLGTTKPTVRLMAEKKQLRYVRICVGTGNEMSLYYKVDVKKMKKQMVEKMQEEIDRMKDQNET